MRIVVLSKRQYTNKDVIDDRYGRLWEIPLAMASEGHSVTCICLSYKSRKSQSEVFAVPGGQSIRWLSVNLGALGIFGFFKYFFLARKIIRAERPDVIWSCSDTIYTVLGRYFSKRFHCRSVSDLYDNFEYFGSYRIPFLRSRFRNAVRESDGVSCVSQALSRHIQSSYGRSKPTSVITNAVDTSVFEAMDKNTCRDKLGLPRDTFLVGAAGDISDFRGADMMYRAFSECAADLGGIELVVAGFRTSDTNIPKVNNIRDLGSLAPADVPVFLNCLDVAVIYNRSSTFGDF
jgi:teichuronic acid biosynthesis glycosyltransferase TuaC